MNSRALIISIIVSSLGGITFAYFLFRNKFRPSLPQTTPVKQIQNEDINKPQGWPEEDAQSEQTEEVVKIPSFTDKNEENSKGENGVKNAEMHWEQPIAIEYSWENLNSLGSGCICGEIGNEVPLIVDHGSFEFRAGLKGEKPSVVWPNIVGRSKSK